MAKLQLDRRDSSNHKELCKKIDNQCEMLKMEPKAHQDILNCVHKNSKDISALSIKFDNFEKKLEPLLNVIDGLVILGELGNSGAAKGLKKLFAVITAISLFIASIWYALTHLGGE